jgi:hypothetical protein
MQVRKIFIVFIFVAIALLVILLVVNKKFIESPNQTAASPPQIAQTTKKEAAFRDEKPPCPDFYKAKSLHIMISDSFTRASAINPSFDFKRIIGKCYRTVINGNIDWQWLSPTSMLYFFYIEDYRSWYTIRIDYDGFEPLPSKGLSFWRAVLIGIEPYTYIAQRGPKTIPHFKVVRFYEASGYQRDRDGKVFKTYEEIEKYGEDNWGLFFTEKKKKY